MKFRNTITEGSSGKWNVDTSSSSDSSIIVTYYDDYVELSFYYDTKWRLNILPKGSTEHETSVEKFKDLESQIMKYSGLTMPGKIIKSIKELILRGHGF